MLAEDMHNKIPSCIKKFIHMKKLNFANAPPTQQRKFLHRLQKHYFILQMMNLKKVN